MKSNIYIFILFLPHLIETYVFHFRLLLGFLNQTRKLLTLLVMRKWRLVPMSGTLFFPVLALQDPSLFQTLFVVTAGLLFLLLTLLYIRFFNVLYKLIYISHFFPGWIFSDSVEAVQLFLPKQKILLPNFLGCCLEHDLCMGIYSSLNVR